MYKNGKYHHSMHGNKNLSMPLPGNDPTFLIHNYTNRTTSNMHHLHITDTATFPFQLTVSNIYSPSLTSGLLFLLVIHNYNLHYFPKSLKILPKVCLRDVGWKPTQKYFRVAVAAFWLL